MFIFKISISPCLFLKYYTVQGPQNICDKLLDFLRHTSILHVSSDTGARTTCP